MCIASKTAPIHNRSAARIEYLSFLFIGAALRSMADLLRKHVCALRLFPFPCTPDDLVQFRMARLPSELLLQFLGTRTQDRRVALPPRGVLYSDALLRELLHRLTDLLDRMGPACANVVGVESGRLHFFQGQHVGFGNVEYVDVIAHARSIRRGIIRSVNFDGFSPARSRLQQ